MPRARIPLPAEVGTSQPTPPEVFHDRRRFIRAAAAASLMGVSTACGRQAAGPAVSADGPNPRLEPPIEWPPGFTAPRAERYGLPAALERQRETSRLAAATTNNFYEFLPGRAGPVWGLTDRFVVDPWSVEIGGECAKPTTIGLEDLLALEHEERLYHFRCVERWAMNVPWVGFPLSRLLERVEPNGHAKFVRFVTANRPDQMPGLAESGGFEWPYHEALRIDEAMNELAMVVTGVYGEPLLKQHGAPIRIIVPWKYGYKNPKSIVKIELLREQPLTFWARPPYTHEYGFLSNVNPNIPHPRWSQSRSYWLGDRAWFQTPIFNGYGDYVADLYPDEPRTPQQALGRGDTAR